MMLTYRIGINKLLTLTEIWFN